MLRVVTVLNQKGGVGKTSLCHHVGGTWAKQGMRVLLIDNDPQASLTQGFYGPAAVGNLPAPATVAALYDTDATPNPAAIILPTGFESLSIVPGSPHLATMNTTPAAEWGARENGLRDFLEQVRDDYDFVLIDNPPNLYLCARASLVASDCLLVPLMAEDYGAQGLGPVRAAMESVKATANPALWLLGYVVTMYDQRLGVHQSYDAILRESFGEDVLETRVPRAKDFVEAVAARKPISHFKPRTAAAKATQALGDELARRYFNHAGEPLYVCSGETT